MTFTIGLVVLVVLWTGLFLWLKPAGGPQGSDRRQYSQITPQVRLRVLGAVALVLGVWIIANCFTVISVGSMGVATWFQNVQKTVYTEGLQLVNPFLDFHAMSARRRVVEFHAQEKDVKDKSSIEDVVSLSSNNVPLTIDVTYAFMLNPKYAWWVYQHMGLDDAYTDTLVKQVARSATRAATSGFTSDEATTSKRDELTRAMENQFRNHLTADMIRQGLPKEDAEQVFNVLPVQLRKALPPDKVLNAIAEKAAAEQDLQRQVTLTAIAQQEAQRRGNEGTGVQMLFTNLPKGFSPEQISLVVNALANKTKGDAILKAVESGKISIMVVDGSPVSVPAR